MEINFTKMHGLGNDFILIDCRENKLPAGGAELSILSRQLCHRKFGVGADQLLLLYPSELADFRMRIFNADGSDVEMCGNGIRCFAKYIWDRGLTDKKVMDIETLAGIIRPAKAEGLVRVDMGEPVFAPEKIPVNIGQEPEADAKIIDYPLHIDDRELKLTCVSMGNPHAVIVVDNVSTFPVTYLGPMVENNPIFPNRTNVEFVEVLNSSEIKIRVWERGAGETLACGTGASAAAVASHLKGLTDNKVTVHLLGGDLFIDWGADRHVYMTGPAVEVFNGKINLQVSILS